jgi:hypothetical protein
MVPKFSLRAFSLADQANIKINILRILNEMRVEFSEEFHPYHF